MNQLTEEIASGQKILIYTIIANFVISAGNKGMTNSIFMVIALAITCAALYGIYRLTSGLQYNLLAKIAFMICMFIPLINIIVMIYLSMQATKHLRAEGYEVGLLGVKN